VFKIKKVEIDGFWGNYKLQTDLDESVNVFIGLNGSGKTTFINFLEASLTADLDLLESLQFNEIRLLLQNKQKTRKIIITRIPEEATYDRIVFQIGARKIRLPLLPKEAEPRRRRLYPKYIESLNEIHVLLSQLVNISWLSVHRELLEDEYRDPYTRRTITEKNPVDRRIDDLEKRFTKYQLLLQGESNKLSSNFRKQVLISMLYSDQFDRFIAKRETIPDIQLVKDGLLRTYQDLEALDPEVRKRINKHIDMLGVAIKAFQKITKDTTITIDDILPITLLRRTQHIVELSTDIEGQRKEIFKPVENYLDILRKFAKDKTFELDPNLSGELIVRKGDMKLSLEQLSSGEKQLFILLTEALLQRGLPYVFIADEPELSLHIGWQKQILSSIKSLNQNAQIIVATHAPEVAGKWRNFITKMEDIIHEQ
jgi:predicted ATP-dependent endonuclease of OLD family